MRRRPYPIPASDSPQDDASSNAGSAARLVRKFRMRCLPQGRQIGGRGRRRLRHNAGRFLPGAMTGPVGRAALLRGRCDTGDAAVIVGRVATLGEINQHQDAPRPRSPARRRHSRCRRSTCLGFGQRPGRPGGDRVLADAVERSTVELDPATDCAVAMQRWGSGSGAVSRPATGASPSSMVMPAFRRRRVRRCWLLRFWTMSPFSRPRPSSPVSRCRPVPIDRGCPLRTPTLNNAVSHLTSYSPMATSASSPTARADASG